MTKKKEKQEQTIPEQIDALQTEINNLRKDLRADLEKVVTVLTQLKERNRLR